MQPPKARVYSKLAKFISLFTFVLFISPFSFGQVNFDISLEELQFSGIPELQSFSWGKSTSGKFLLIGGRTDGLHRRQPHSSFSESGNNSEFYLVDPENKTTTSRSMLEFSSSIQEQLRSTNQEFLQIDSMLYIIGGYGYSQTAADHITFPYICALDINGLEKAINDDKPISSFIRQFKDDRFAVTGGQIGMIDSMVYLCGGQKFTGRYNPMGPDHGPGFEQEYTNAIRKFALIDDGNNIEIRNFTSWEDSLLHRRDYNMLPRIKSDGEEELIMFSGVFQFTKDLPWLDCIQVSDESYSRIPNFNQYLSQYHSAKIAIAEPSKKRMNYVFFGGMSQYTLDGDNNLIKDDDVPFVKTISVITETSSGEFTEHKLSIEMPGLEGSGAEFIPASENLYLERDVLDLSKVNSSKQLIGYIVGGIESTAANIFFVNDGSQSNASAKVIGVYISPSTLTTNSTPLLSENIIQLQLEQNPVSEYLNLDLFIPDADLFELTILSVTGEKISHKTQQLREGKQNLKVDVRKLKPGMYFLQFNNRMYSTKAKFYKY